MKTKELVKILNDIDPEGEMDVCINNQDISGLICAEPAYWDGRLQKVTKRDKYGDALETTITTGGSKINLSPIDLCDKYTSALLYYGQEYPIFTSGGMPNNYSWLDADWTSKKVDWLIWTEKYIESDMKSGGYTKEPEKKLEFIKNLKDKYRAETVKALKEYASNNFRRRQRNSAIKLLDKLTEKRPIILDVFRHGSNYVAMSGSAWKSHEFQIYKNGDVKYKKFSDKYWTSIDLEFFDFDEIVKKFDEMQENKFL